MFLRRWFPSLLGTKGLKGLHCSSTNQGRSNHQLNGCWFAMLFFVSFSPEYLIFTPTIIVLMMTNEGNTHLKSLILVSKNTAQPQLTSHCALPLITILICFNCSFFFAPGWLLSLRQPLPKCTVNRIRIMPNSTLCSYPNCQFKTWQFYWEVFLIPGSQREHQANPWQLHRHKKLSFPCYSSKHRILEKHCVTSWQQSCTQTSCFASFITIGFFFHLKETYCEQAVILPYHFPCSNLSFEVCAEVLLLLPGGQQDCQLLWCDVLQVNAAWSLVRWQGAWRCHQDLSAVFTGEGEEVEVHACCF